MVFQTIPLLKGEGRRSVLDNIVFTLADHDTMLIAAFVATFCLSWRFTPGYAKMDYAVSVGVLVFSFVPLFSFLTVFMGTSCP